MSHKKVLACVGHLSTFSPGNLPVRQRWKGTWTCPAQPGVASWKMLQKNTLNVLRTSKCCCFQQVLPDCQRPSFTSFCIFIISTNPTLQSLMAPHPSACFFKQSTFPKTICAGLLENMSIDRDLGSLNRDVQLYSIYTRHPCIFRYPDFCQILKYRWHRLHPFPSSGVWFTLHRLLGEPHQRLWTCQPDRS